MTPHPARIAPRANPVQLRGQRRDIIVQLRAAAGDFARAWGRARPVERGENLRVAEAILGLAFITAVVAIGAFYDAAATRWAASLPPILIEIFARITHLGESGYIFVLTIAVILGALLMRNAGRSRKANAALGVLAGRAFYVFVAAAASGLLSQLLKHLFGRARPKLIDVVGPMHFDAFSINATYASFPSGHAVTAFAMAFALAVVAPRLRWPLLTLAILIAASRVIIGAHYLSDVMAGAGLGYGVAVLARRAFATRRIVFFRDGAKIYLRGAGLVRRALLSGAAR